MGERPQKLPVRKHRFWVRPRRGVTARRTEPGNRAHAFRMTLVVQGNKLPQIIVPLPKGKFVLSWKF